MFELAIKILEKKISMLKVQIDIKNQRMSDGSLDINDNYEESRIINLEKSIETLKNIENNNYCINNEIDEWLEEYTNFDEKDVLDSFTMVSFTAHEYSIGILELSMQRVSLSKDDVNALKKAVMYLQRDAILYASLTKVGQWMVRFPLQLKK